MADHTKPRIRINPWWTLFPQYQLQNPGCKWICSDNDRIRPATGLGASPASAYCNFLGRTDAKVKGGAT